MMTCPIGVVNSLRFSPWQFSGGCTPQNGHERATASAMTSSDQIPPEFSGFAVVIPAILRLMSGGGTASTGPMESTTGGTIYGMEKTTVYLPPDLKAAVKHTAQRRGVSEADVIRESIRAAVDTDRPAPRGGIYSGSEPMARQVDDLLEGFGER